MGICIFFQKVDLTSYVLSLFEKEKEKKSKCERWECRLGKRVC